MNVQVTNKIDFGYENYRNSNINWRDNLLLIFLKFIL
jgi:hypothetical protein